MKLSTLDNLRFRVALVILSVTLLPLGFVSLFSIWTAEQIITRIVTNQLDNMAAEKQDLLERWIAERKADVGVVAGSSIVRGMEAVKIESQVRLVQQQYGTYQRFVVVGPDGQTVFDTQSDSPRSHRREAWHQHLETEPIYMSEVRRDPDGEGSVFQIAQRVLSATGKRQGAVCATVSTQAILARVLTVSLGETGECYLVDQSGTFMAHQEPARILRENISQSESFAHVFGGSGPRPIYTDYRGIAVLGASRAVTGTPWYVVVEQDRDEAFAGSYQMTRMVGIAAALTLAVAIALSWLLASYVASPICTLSEAAYALSRGDFQSAMQAQTTRHDEIGALYTAFHHMAGQLGNRQEQLQTRIGVTEAELQKAADKLQSTLEAAARSEHLAALGRLAAGVAHEIRTPLTSLKLFLQSVQEEINVTAEHAEDYRIAMQQVRRIEGTINLFLDFARPGRPVLADVDFERLLDDALVVVQPRANQQEVEIRRSIAPRLPEVEGDLRQLCEAIVNLLLNALEAMPGKGRLSIAVYSAVDESNSERLGVQIDVADTGPGIEPSDVGRLFEPFFTTKASGSGLGLAIVRGTVERHGGKIQVQTRLGDGTTFSIFLPARPL